MAISVKCEDEKLIIERDKVRGEELAAEKVFMEAETKKLRARFQKKQEELRARFAAERQAGYGNVQPERRDKE